MHKIKLLIAIAAIGAFGTAHASIVNGSFENGLSSWTTFGTNATNTVAHTAGLSSALITAADGGVTNATALETFAGVSDAALRSIKSGKTNFTTGSAIQQTFYAAAGSTLAFDYRTLTDEGIPTEWDFTFVVIDGVAQALGDTNIDSGFGAGLLGFGSANSWKTFDTTFTSTGNHTVTFGALQAGDTLTATALLIDNVKSSAEVPEPATVALLGLGLLGMAASRRKTKK